MSRWRTVTLFNCIGISKSSTYARWNQFERASKYREINVGARLLHMKINENNLSWKLLHTNVHTPSTIRHHTLYRFRPQMMTLSCNAKWIGPFHVCVCKKINEKNHPLLRWSFFDGTKGKYTKRVHPLSHSKCIVLHSRKKCALPIWKMDVCPHFRVRQQLHHANCRRSDRRLFSNIPSTQKILCH